MHSKTSTTKEEHIEAQLDEALTLTFPASDPIAVVSDPSREEVAHDKRDEVRPSEVA